MLVPLLKCCFKKADHRIGKKIVNYEDNGLFVVLRSIECISTSCVKKFRMSRKGF